MANSQIPSDGENNMHSTSSHNRSEGTSVGAKSKGAQRKVERNESFAAPHREGLSLHQGFQMLAGVMVVLALVVAFVLVRPSIAQDVTSAGDSLSPTQGGIASATNVMATGKTTQVTVKVEGMSFTPSNIDVPTGNKLVITFNNTGDQRHDLVLDNGAKTSTIAPGDTATLEAGVIGNSMEGWCSLPGHRQMGMNMTITATGAGAGTGSMGSMAGGSHSMGSSSSDVAVPTMDQLKKQAKKEKPYNAKLADLNASKVHDYTLTVTEDTQTLAEGVTRKVWTYNKTAPGPVFHGRVGDTFNITLVNKGSMGHSIDFHAGQSNPDEVMKTIEPGETLKYSFTADHTGIWLYHCSTAPMSNHIANGMHGAVIIEPDNLDKVDAQYVLIQGEMYLGENGGAADATKVAAITPDLVAFNGRAFQYDMHPFTMKAGQTIRIWVLDAGPNTPLSFHIVGTQFKTVWKEGAYQIRNYSAPGMTPGQTATQALSLQAAQGGFVELTVPDEGTYSIVNHIMSLAEKGAHGTLKVTK